MASSDPYPVTLIGRPEPTLSRWLWLVKWLLLVPHLIVLAFLWIAVGAVSVVAWFAILVTARYPQRIFAFNLGVLRWTWRVLFYGYGALGTDRYPPFTLGAAPDYPAQLDIAYPERLSRGLVLVKSWLLAIPHYLVLGFFLGIGTGGMGGRGPGWPWTAGLDGLLVLFLGVVLLFTGRHLRSAFDFVLGMDRWSARVAAYVLLMTDRYPPFRLDQGGEEVPASPPPPTDAGSGMSAAVAGASAPEPGREAGPAPTTAPTPAPTTAPTTGRWTGLRIVAVTVGCLLLALALAAGLGGGGLLFADKHLRDDNGFVMSGTEAFTTSSYAVATQNIALPGGSAAHRLIGDVQVTATGTDRPVFLGVAATTRVSRYLAGVGHVVVTDVRSGTPVYRRAPGGAPTTAPAQATFWAAHTAGDGKQVLRWRPQDGDWTVVLMNADGSAGVAANVAAGATLPLLGWGAVTLFVTGAVLFAGGLVLVLLALPRPPASGTTAGTTPATSPQPSSSLG